jgi:hypothetical protein
MRVAAVKTPLLIQEGQPWGWLGCSVFGRVPRKASGRAIRCNLFNPRKNSGAIKRISAPIPHADCP